MPLTVTLLGGESSGKTSLAQALHQSLAERGVACQLVDERLRDWCERQGRAPLAHEQAARAQDQRRAITDASGDDSTEVVLADTTALVIAAYSELYFDDRSLWPAAIAQQRRYGLSLLMGLDLPWVADGLFRDSPTLREATDAVLRRELQAACIPFQTLYGPLALRVQQALRAIGTALQRPLAPEDPAWAQGRRPWNLRQMQRSGLRTPALHPAAATNDPPRPEHDSCYPPCPISAAPPFCAPTSKTRWASTCRAPSTPAEACSTSCATTAACTDVHNAAPGQQHALRGHAGHGGAARPGR